MTKLRTLVTVPIAAATAFVVGMPAAAAAAPTGTAAAGAAVHITRSPVHNLYLEGGCPPDSALKSVAAMQRIDWIWAPFALDNVDPKAGRLPKVLLPISLTIVDSTGLRARHDLLPGAAPTNPTT